MLPVISLGFTSDFTYREIEAPADVGARAVIEFTRYPRMVPMRRTLVEVARKRTAQWVGSFQSGFTDYTLSGVYLHPDPDRAVIVLNGEAYLISAKEPGKELHVGVSPVLGLLRVPDRELIVLWDFQRLAVHGKEGLVWCLPNLAVDGLSVTSVDHETIHGTVEDMINNREVPFAVDIDTGRATGGWGD